MKPCSRIIYLIIALITGCSLFAGEEAAPLFKRLPPTQTGIRFSNEITYTTELNILNYSYLYNGGGVAAGDINNDGLLDLYFTGNMVSSRLYLNKGNFKFEDITEASGTATQYWAGGVSMVDINHDGYLDIYVSITGTEHTIPEERANLLFINNQDNTFTESAAQYGLADTGYTIHSAFFDYDRDGDLDVCLINNFVGSFSFDSRIGLRPEVNDGTALSTDVLYRNDTPLTPPSRGDRGVFTDVSRKAGILKEGYSLGLAVCDLNRDGWPDIYVSNDIQTDDLLYINNGDGTFTDKAADYFKHTSNAGMGTDVADFNNDGWPDVVQVDLMPPALHEQKLITGIRDYDYLKELQQKGYQSQYIMNSLQLSNGVDDQGNIIFSEISRLAGIATTDWSWTALFGDYDNDGLKDIMITNGYPKAVNSYDYLMKLNRSTMFGTDSVRKRREYEMMDSLRILKMPNYFYKNNGDLTFSDVSEEWGFTEPSLSYGAAQADLDNDGDLDIAINNINGAAGIYQNTADSVTNNHYLKIRLKGDSLNTRGTGSKLVLTVNGKKQYAYFSPYRGYQSAMDHKIYFGLEDYQMADSLEIIWPDGRYQLIKEVASDQVLTLDYREAVRRIPDQKKNYIRQQPFVEAGRKLVIDYKHTENEYVDFEKEPLLPHMLSRLGPPVAVGDVNNDQRDDFYIGGAAGHAGSLFIQQEDGTFKESAEQQPWAGDRSFEDTGAAFFDANGDGFIDLYVVSGGTMFSPASAQLQDRLYLNSGNGQFVKAVNMLPRIYTSGSVVKPADYDRDGDLDLFTGGRLVPGRYPMPAKSYILRNDDGIFMNVTDDIAPELVEPGLITDAIWIDFNEDGNLDLITTGIWMPVSFYEQTNGMFKNVTASVGLDQYIGWWTSIEKGDIDNDGDMDLVAGNFGLNHLFSAPGNPPLHIFAHDFDENHSLDAILAINKDGLYYPLHGMRSMMEQLPYPMRRIRSFEAYAGATLRQIVGTESIENARHYRATYFASSVIINQGGGSFQIQPLSNETQISSINDILLLDLNEDKKPDLLVAGNTYNSHPQIPRNDAGNGLMLIGDGQGNFTPISPFKSSFLTPLNVRNLALINTIHGRAVLVTNNNDSLRVLSITGMSEGKISYK